MRKTYLFSLLAALFSVMGGQAQTLYSEPSPLQVTSQDIKVYFNAVGTPLEGQSPTAKLYAHTGYAIDGKEKDWINAPTWGTNEEKYQLQYVSDNLWMLFIGDMVEYYGIPEPLPNVTSLNFVFRAASNSPQTSDLFLPVYESGLQVSLVSDASGNIITGETSYVTFKVNTTESANITLKVGDTQIATASGATYLEESYTFTQPGDYTVTATATANGETASESLMFHYLANSVEQNYPGGTPVMGPVANADGSVTFCLGALEKKHVVLVGAWNDYAYSPAQVMNYQDTDNGRYFWVTVSGLDPDVKYPYYFVIDGGEYTVGDPYARLVLDPYNDKYLDTNVFPGLPEYPTDALDGQNVPVAVYWGNINQYDWKVDNFEIPEKNNLIIYELLFRDFTGTEGKASGNGTVQQAIEKLDYLKQLGVNAIELLPIMEFNGNISWGYNPNFYFAVDKAYGTPDDYKEFIDLCHQNGMAVILDMVFNQSDGLHPWYQMYDISKNPYYNLNAPHAYSVLNDWNQGTPQVQEQWADVLRYWMTEYKFDGFRFDLVKGLGLNSSYPNNGDGATNQYNSSRVEEMLYLQSVMMEVNPDAIFINENLATAKEENEMSDTSQERWGNMQLNWANINDPGCQFAMGYNSNSNMNPLYAVQNSRTWGSTVSYLESHDEQRLAYKQDQWGVSGVKGNPETSMQRLGSAAAQMIMTPGAHMIWQFSEMGNAQNTKNNDGGNNTDPKIVNWDLLDDANHLGLYNNYCQLIEIRMKNSEMFSKDANFTIQCSNSDWADGRMLSSVYDGKELYTLVNPNVTGNLTMKVDFLNKDNSAYKILTKSYASNSSFDASAGTVIVPANCYVVIGSADLEESGVETLVADDAANALKARGGFGEVIVDYALAPAVVYSLNGKVMGSVKESGKISVASGLYIVKSGKNSVKVYVK